MKPAYARNRPKIRVVHGELYDQDTDKVLARGIGVWYVSSVRWNSYLATVLGVPSRLPANQLGYVFGLD